MDRKIKVLVNGHDLKFWRGIQNHLETTGLFEFKQDVWTGHDSHDEGLSQELLPWADVIFCEWTMGNAVWYSHRKLPHQRLVTRLHLQERTTDYPAKLKHDNVDQICFVGEHIRQEVMDKFGIPDHKSCVISNYVDFERYSLPKSPQAQFNLGMIGIVPLRKRMDLAFDTLSILLQQDDRYTLHIKGPSPDSYDWLWARTAERAYYENLWQRIRNSSISDRVIFHPPGNDIHEWFQDIGYLLSPSDYESFHMAVAEGMCSGTLPIVWDWEGASDIYRLLTPVKNANQAAQTILRYTNSSAAHTFSAQSKSYVKEHFDRNTVCKQWEEMLTPQKPLEVPSNISMVAADKVLVVWMIGDWGIFHRCEMISALARHLDGRVSVLVIEPGDNAEELIRRQSETEDSISDYLHGKIRKRDTNVSSTRIITNSIPTKLSRKLSVKAVEHQLAGKALSRTIKNAFPHCSQLLHWIFKPNQVDRLDQGTASPFVYEIYDDYTFDFGSGTPIPEMAVLERTACSHSQHVFFTAQELYDRKKSLCSSASVVSNGVNYEIFEKYRPPSTADTDRDIRRSVGYLGNLSDFFDWDLVLGITKRLPHVNFFFHGGIETARLEGKKDTVDQVIGLPNTCFTGRVSREAGAAAIARYDVLIVPFVVNEAMHAVNPLKLWEYFAVAKPVVSSPMDAIAYLDGPVIFAKTEDEWVESISKLIRHTPSAGFQTELIDLAKAHSWESLTANHAEVVLEYFDSISSHPIDASQIHERK